jgi:hypothetical protein
LPATSCSNKVKVAHLVLVVSEWPAKVRRLSISIPQLVVPTVIKGEDPSPGEALPPQVDVRVNLAALLVLRL